MLTFEKIILNGTQLTLFDECLLFRDGSDYLGLFSFEHKAFYKFEVKCSPPIQIQSKQKLPTTAQEILQFH